MGSFDTAMDELEQAHQQGCILGLKKVSGVVQRFDIDVMLMTQPDTFNLFLIAMMELKGSKLPWDIPAGYKFTSDDIMSWFQIAGIHGLPKAHWADETGKPSQPGYCNHAVPTFSPWHRPYIAMLEQTLFRQVNNIAKRFSESSEISQADKAKYIAAAKQFRLPYWDYYRPRDYKVEIPGISKDGNGTITMPYNYRAPQIFTLPEVMVKSLPHNELIPMKNPFFNYVFGEKDTIEWEDSGLNRNWPFAECQTIRHGDAESPQHGVERMNIGLNQIREDEMRCSLIMIEKGVYSNFKAFSDCGVDVKQKWKFDEILRKNTGSIEGLHNDYHVFIGGYPGERRENDPKKLYNGHMSCQPVAAFDPIFWIHHGLLAIWQAANPTERIQPELADTPLEPFRKWPLADKKDVKNRYWTPEQVWDTTKFGYVYPETAGGCTGDDVREEFVSKYGWSRRLKVHHLNRDEHDPNEGFGPPPRDMLPLQVQLAQVFQYTPGLESDQLLKRVPPPPEPEPERPLAVHTAAKFSQEWYIDTVVERMALHGSFTIFYIIGDVLGRDAQGWTTSPGFAGVSHVFTGTTESCGSCALQQVEAKFVTSTTPITSLLLDYQKAGLLKSLKHDDVEDFLVKNLKWRIQPADGLPVDPRTLTRAHKLRFSVSVKTAPLPGQEGPVEYHCYREIIKKIIHNSS